MINTCAVDATIYDNDIIQHPIIRRIFPFNIVYLLDGDILQRLWFLKAQTEQQMNAYWNRYAHFYIFAILDPAFASQNSGTYPYEKSIFVP